MWEHNRVNYLSGGKLRRDSGKVNHRKVLEKNPLLAGLVLKFIIYEA